jgi:hypothetical protein
MLIYLNADEIHVFLKMMTEDQLAVSLELREARPHAEYVKRVIWKKLHDALDGQLTGSVTIQ